MTPQKSKDFGGREIVARLLEVEQSMRSKPEAIDKHWHLRDNHPIKWLKSDYTVWGGETDHSTGW
jgi:hypothetical protein